MPEKSNITNDKHNPVAIFDKELLSATAFTLYTFELCTMCNDPQATDETEELPRKLMEILAKDHRQNRAHKCFIELGV